MKQKQIYEWENISVCTQNVNVFGKSIYVDLTTRLNCGLFSRKLPKGEVPEAIEKSYWNKKFTFVQGL